MSIGNLHMLLASTSHDVFRFQSNALAWGCNSLGQLGDGTFTSKSSPVFVLGGFKDWSILESFALEFGQGISAHPVGDNTLAIRDNGELWGWGNNISGQLGDGTTTQRNSPVSVVGGYTDWTQVSAGIRHSLGVRSDGTAWAWGGGSYGKLGDNTIVDKSSPVSVVGGFTDWAQLSAGAQHSIGVRNNGTAWAWGGASNGKLGDNTIVNKSSPVSVVGGFTDWYKVSAGNFHNIGVRENGTAWSWGSNSFGRLGDNTTIVRSSPVSVVGGFTDWYDVSAGLYHSAGVRSSGTAWSWGAGGNGRLGNNADPLGGALAVSSPVQVAGGFTDWIQVSCGNAHSAGVRENGTAWGWGFNGQGQLGDSTTIDRSSPVSVVGGITDWFAVTTGEAFTVGIKQT